MKLTLSIRKATLIMAFLACAGASSGVNINDGIPGADASGRVGALMPYTRYDSEEADLGGGAILKSSSGTSMTDIAAQASEHSYISLPGSGSYAEWTAIRSGNGVTMRFTMPDATSGTSGLTGSLEIYVDGQKRRVMMDGLKYQDNISLSSYSMWQYFDRNIGGTHTDNASDSYIEGATACFAFDEVGFIVEGGITKGQTVKIQSTGANGLEYGVDFLEIEKVTKIEKPDGWVEADGNLQEFLNAHQGQKIYLHPGVWTIGGKLTLPANTQIMGAGIYYTTLHFTRADAGGGAVVTASGTTLRDVHITSMLNSRHNQGANYKGLEGGPDGFTGYNLWIQHFECGAWFERGNNIKIVNCRLRDNLADGLNFCRNTNNSTVYNCSVRNNGDDGLAMWNVEEEYNNKFCYNTVEFDWRAGGIGVFGGVGHEVYNNLVVHSVYAAGIRVNTDFPGPAFSNTSQEQPIKFSNNTISCSGANVDIFGGTLPAVDIRGDVKYVNFSNTKIYNSHWQDVRNTTGISFSYTSLSDDPGYPPVDDSEEALVIKSPLDGITGYDVKVEALAWQNASGSTSLKKGDKVTFTVKVTNPSSVSIPAKALVAVDVVIDDATKLSASSRDGLGAGESQLFTFEWTATAGGHTVVATVDPNNKLPDEIAENNNTREKKFNVDDVERVINREYAASSGIDLYVTDITYKNITTGKDNDVINAGDLIQFVALVVNAGSENWSGGSKCGLQFRIDGAVYPAMVTWNDKNYGPWNSHEFKEMASTGGNSYKADGNRDSDNGTGLYWKATTGSHSVTAVIDDDGKVTESNEGNNATTISLPAIPYIINSKYDNPDEPDNLNGEPVKGKFDDYTDYDLQLVGLGWNNAGNKTDDSMQVDDKVTLTGRVKNVGTQEVPNEAKVTLQISVDGTAHETSFDTGLAAGAEKELTLEWTATAGGHTLTGKVIPDTQLPTEKNKDNNTCNQRKFNVQGNKVADYVPKRDYTPTTGGYDLAVTDVTYYNETKKTMNGSIDEGDVLRFTAYIVNAGNQTTPSNIKHGVEFQVDKKASPITWNDKFYGPLASHATCDLQATGGNGDLYTWTATKGSHTVMAWVNDTNDLNEEVGGNKANNNYYTIDLTIPYEAPTSPTMYDETDFPDLFVGINIDGRVGRATVSCGYGDVKIPAGLTAYTVAVNEKGKITHPTTWNAGEIVPKGTGFVVEGPAGNYLLPIVTLGSPKSVDGANYLSGQDKGGYTTTATYDAKFYKLALSQKYDNPGFYFGAANGAAFTIAGNHRAYLAVPKGNANVKSNYLFDEYEATGIDALSADSAAGECYSLQGVRVERPSRPGIYVIGGKKYVVR